MSQPISSILSATDFSQDSRGAARRAAMLAAHFPADLKLVHAVEPRVLQVLRETLRLSFSTGPDAVTDRLGEQLQGMAQELKSVTGREVATELLEGRASEVIPGTANQHDLFVLGAQGAHRIRELALGTTAQRIMDKVESSVLVVRGAADQPYKRILLATDFSESAERAASLAQAFSAGQPVQVAHVFELHHELQTAFAEVNDEAVESYRQQCLEDVQQRMVGFLGKAGLDASVTRTHINEGYPPKTLAEIAQSEGIDLLVLGKHGHTAAERFFAGSVAHNLLADAPCDVLVVA